MHRLICFVLVFSFPFETVVSKRFDLKQMKCLVCQRVVEEIEKEIDKIDPSRKVDVGSYRLDNQGEVKKSVVELRRSEVFLTDVIEKTCEKMDDYVRATYKSNGQLTVIKLVSDDGKMNPDLGEVDIVTDGDIESLKFYCESILEEYEDVAMKLFRSGVDNIDIRLCSDSAHFCNQSLDDEYNFEEEKDEL
ncbi:protein seele [Homalodisca vitripennis]|uniref:protein seele n=1 Tax=Homalodisca vitripennis TaxID=197043 RepID=UPI001EEC9ECD|nr:protein seele [Homalodisca vitripennis]